MPTKRTRKNPPTRRCSSARGSCDSAVQGEDTRGTSNSQPEAPECSTNDGLTTRERLTSQLYRSLLGNGIIALHHPPGTAPSYFLIQGGDTRPSYSVPLEGVSKLVDTLVTRWNKAGIQSVFDFSLFGEELEGSLKELLDGIFHEWYGVFGEGVVFDEQALQKAKRLWV